jgi:phosphoribosylformimino-5-aminoimidazole carboxamide ribotide isomerase
VRLEQGDMARATVFNLDPGGADAPSPCRALSICTLTSTAFAGKPMNARRRGDAEGSHHAGYSWRHPRPENHRGVAREGIARVIIGTAAVRD